MALSSVSKNRPLGIDILHVFALVGVAVAQPIYSTLADGPEFFVANNAGALQITALVLMLSFGLPFAVAAVEIALRLISRKIQQFVHLIVVWILLTFLVLQIVNRFFEQSFIVPISLAVVTGVVCTALYARSLLAKRLVTFLSIGALFFPLNFLLISPVSRIFLPGQTTAVAGVDASNAKTPVVLVIFDEFNPTALLNKEGRIDAVRFPHFAQLAANSWWFPRATSTHPQTHFAVPAILTGKLPDPEKVFPSYRDHPNNLFTMLGNDYSFNVKESITSLCPKTICVNDEESFQWKIFASDIFVVYGHSIIPHPIGERFLAPLSAGWDHFEFSAKSPSQIAEMELLKKFNSLSDESRLSSFRQFIKDIDGNEKTLNFLHILLPHKPYEFMPDGTYYQRVGDFGIDQTTIWSSDQHFLSFAYKRYIMQVGFIDHMLGKLIQKLKSVNAYDKSLIIITADHGRAFTAGVSDRALTYDNVDVLHVPLFIKLPNQRKGNIDERLASNIDVLPTIADILDVDLDWHLDGESVFSSSHTENRELKVIFRSKHFDLDRNAIVSLPLLKWQTQTFGSGTLLSALTIAGPYSDLVGRNVDSLDVVEAPEEQTPRIMQNFTLLGDVVPNSDFRPSLVSSEVVNLGEIGRPWIALALNDQIVAVTQVYKDEDGSSRILALFPPGAITAGRNTLSAFQVLDSGGYLKFRPVSTELDDYELEHQGAVEILVSSHGDKYPINAGKSFGTVDRASLDGTVVNLAGWSADVDALEPAKVVAVFMDGKFICTISANLDRPDVAEHFESASLKKSGFSTGCPVHGNARSLDSLRAFGITPSGTAGELHFSNS